MEQKRNRGARLVQHLTYAALLFACYGLFSHSSAHAQYKHNRLGGGLGFLYTFNVGGNPSANDARSQKGYGVGVGASFYIEGGHRFMDQMGVYGLAHLSLHACGTPNDICKAGSTPLMVTILTDLRYFFLTDEFRPYLGIGVGYWRSLTFVRSSINSVGPTISGGFDWFIKEEISIGLRLRYGLQLFVVPETGLVPFHSLLTTFTFSAYL